MHKPTRILGLILILSLTAGIACAGSVGPAGPAGPQGAQGTAGAAGPQGEPGPAAAAGAQGERGSAGTAGTQGAQGAAGPGGARGAQGSPGSAGPAGTPGASASADPGDAPLDLVSLWGATAAVAPFHDVEQAIADGYRQITPCVADPEKGAQGFHYMNRALLDGTVEHNKPEILMYIPSEAGKLTLVGVEYAVPNTVEPVPSLFGHTFHAAPPGVPLLVLHA